MVHQDQQGRKPDADLACTRAVQTGELAPPHRQAGPRVGAQVSADPCGASGRAPAGSEGDRAPPTFAACGGLSRQFGCVRAWRARRPVFRLGDGRKGPPPLGGDDRDPSSGRMAPPAGRADPVPGPLRTARGAGRHRIRCGRDPARPRDGFIGGLRERPVPAQSFTGPDMLLLGLGGECRLAPLRAGGDSGPGADRGKSAGGRNVERVRSSLVSTGGLPIGTSRSIRNGVLFRLMVLAVPRHRGRTDGQASARETGRPNQDDHP